MHNSNQKSSNCNKEVAPKTCHFKQTICRLQKNLIFTQLFPFSSLNLWFTHVLSRKCRKWHFRVLVGSFSLKSRMVGRLDNSGAGVQCIDCEGDGCDACAENVKEVKNISWLVVKYLRLG